MVFLLIFLVFWLIMGIATNSVEVILICSIMLPIPPIIILIIILNQESTDKLKKTIKKKQDNKRLKKIMKIEADIEHPDLAPVMVKLQERSENLRILGRY